MVQISPVHTSRDQETLYDEQSFLSVCLSVSIHLHNYVYLGNVNIDDLYQRKLCLLDLIALYVDFLVVEVIGSRET